MADRLYYVYILASASRVLYTGMTNNLRRGLFEHKQKRITGFTQKYNVTQLMHFDVFSDVRLAIAREKQVKAWTRAKRIALIESTNLHWKDLSADWFPREKQDRSKNDSRLRA